MKSKKHSFFKSLIILLLFVPCIFFFSACSNDIPFYEQAGYESLEAMLEDLKGADGTDGINGIDGVDGVDGSNGKDAPQETSYDIYLKAKELGEYNGTYIDFVKDVLKLTETDEGVLANKNLASVVTVKTNSTSYGGQSGSGVIYRINGDYSAFILTNYHVTYCEGSHSPYEEYKLNLYGNDQTKEFQATYVGGSKNYDIAVLYVDPTNGKALEDYGAVAATLNTNDPIMGTKVFAIGNARGKGLSITSGVVSVDSEYQILSVGGSNPNVRLIRHDAYIFRGNSGGGLFNNKGELIGITNGGLSKGSTNNEANLINFAIPASAVKGVAENIIENCFGTTNKVIKTFDFGFTYESTTSSGTNGEIVSQTDYVYISLVNQSIIPDSPTLVRFDKIVSLSLSDGETEIKKDITRTHHVNDFLLLANDSHTLKIEVSRNGEAENIVVELKVSELEELNIS